jgi:hypothetical protein
MIKFFKHIATASLIMAVAANQANAQTVSPDLDSEKIIITRDYEARIEDAQRLKMNPSIPDTEVETPVLSYEVPSRLLKLKYPPHPVRPLAMPKAKKETFMNSYVKLGFGTQFSPLAELVYNDNSVENLQFGAYYKHLSAYGRRENQKFRHNEMGAYAQYFLKKAETGFNFRFDQDVNHFYGYNSEDTTFNAADVKQRVREIGGDIYIKSGALNDKEVDFDQVASFSTMQDIFGVKEWFIRYNSNITKVFKNNHFLNVMGEVDISNYIPTNRDDLEREIFQIGGDYTFNNDDWKLTAGLVTAFGDVIKDQYFNLYPKLYTEKRLYKNHLIFYSGWSRRLQKNSYLNFVNENPFINANIDVQNSRIEDRMAGFKGSAESFTYNARFSNKVVKGMALFVNDSTDMKRFNVVYDKNLTIINLNIETGYMWNEKLNTFLTVDFMLYEPDEQLKAWHLPLLNTNLTTTYNLKNKILLRGEIYGLAGAYGRNQLGEAELIKGIVDINLGAEYQFSKYLSFFANLNNLANTKYQRFYNYPTFGFNGMVGAKFSY